VAKTAIFTKILYFWDDIDVTSSNNYRPPTRPFHHDDLELPWRLFTYCKRFQVRFFVQWCSGWQDFNCMAYL